MILVGNEKKNYPDLDVGFYNLPRNTYAPVKNVLGDCFYIPGYLAIYPGCNV